MTSSSSTGSNCPQTDSTSSTSDSSNESMHHHLASKWSLPLHSFLSQSFPFPFKCSFLKRFNPRRGVKRTKERTPRNFDWRLRRMLMIRLVTCLWGPYLGVREDAKLPKRILTQALLLLACSILILRNRSHLMALTLGKMKAKKRRKK